MVAVVVPAYSVARAVVVLQVQPVQLVVAVVVVRAIQLAPAQPIQLATDLLQAMIPTQAEMARVTAVRAAAVFQQVIRVPLV